MKSQKVHVTFEIELVIPDWAQETGQDLTACDKNGLKVGARNALMEYWKRQTVRHSLGLTDIEEMPEGVVSVASYPVSVKVIK